MRVRQRNTFPPVGVTPCHAHKSRHPGRQVAVVHATNCCEKRSRGHGGTQIRSCVGMVRKTKKNGNSPQRGAARRCQRVARHKRVTCDWKEKPCRCASRTPLWTQRRERKRALKAKLLSSEKGPQSSARLRATLHVAAITPVAKLRWRVPRLERGLKSPGVSQLVSFVIPNMLAMALHPSKFHKILLCQVGCLVRCRPVEARGRALCRANCPPRIWNDNCSLSKWPGRKPFGSVGQLARTRRRDTLTHTLTHLAPPGRPANC